MKVDIIARKNVSIINNINTHLFHCIFYFQLLKYNNKIMYDECKLIIV